MAWNQPYNPGYSQPPPTGYSAQQGQYGQPPPNTQYGRYGQPPPTSQYGQPPPTSQYGQPPPTSQYGQPPPTSQYGQPPPTSQYGQPPPTSQYGQPPPTSQYGQPPPTSQYGQPPPTSQYGQPPPTSQYGQPPPTSQYGQPPPTSQYGQPPPTSQYGQPPTTSQYGQPPPNSQYGGGYGGTTHPSVPRCPPGVSHAVWDWFQTVDKDRSGFINSVELREALVNNNWSHFNEETCRILIGMFDGNKDGKIDVHEFEALWKYVQEWRNCFERYDRDRSGKIDSSELHQALTEFGYSLSPDFSRLCTRVFDRQDKDNMNFDDFIQCCVMIRMLTDAFRKKDAQQRGMIQIHYEEFLEMVIDNQVV